MAFRKSIRSAFASALALSGERPPEICPDKTSHHTLALGPGFQVTPYVIPPPPPPPTLFPTKTAAAAASAAAAVMRTVLLTSHTVWEQVTLRLLTSTS